MNSTNVMQISPAFKLSLITVSFFTLISLIITLIITWKNSDVATMAEIPEMQRELYGIVKACFQSGFGGILGLLGGKMTSEQS